MQRIWREHGLLKPTGARPARGKILESCGAGFCAGPPKKTAMLPLVKLGERRVDS
jgi:hypothetical protein